MSNKETCTIYLLTNTVNNKIYIGQTWLELHIRMGKNGGNYSNSTYLYSAINKYGSDNFKYTVLAEVATQEEADILETKYIEQYRSMEKDIGYNIKTGGSAGRHSEETKRKISATEMGKTASIETRERMSKSQKGLKKPPHTQEWKDANSIFMKNRHANNVHPMMGKHHSEESKAKISAAQMGRVVSKENLEKRYKTLDSKRDKDLEQKMLDLYQNTNLTIAQICEQLNVHSSKVYHLLKRANIELRKVVDPQLISKINSKRTHSDETKIKMSESRRAYHANKRSN